MPSIYTLDGADVAFCSYRAPRHGNPALWPSRARQEAPRRFDEEHPRGFCSQPTVAILSVGQKGGIIDWEAALCEDHLARYAHLDGTIHKEPKAPTRQVYIFPLSGYLDIVSDEPTRQTRQPRNWKARPH